jgi:cellulose synthase/poly-beta-1,6-N-acetylglucosamine synthase-like glycosyltransferase
MPQYIYLAAVGCYLLFFALFLRLFWWKRYADIHYWKRRPDLSVAALTARARALSQAPPRFTIMVPARNEADVIERTVEHMASLQYPPDLYEVLVVTDGPNRDALIAAARGFYAPTLCIAGPWASPSILDGKTSAPDGASRAFVCTGPTCAPPVSDAAGLLPLLATT